ncbi:hypothetical protein F8M41_006924 [Gigaspora margarita]|uniref:Uncharacterized protein n=1 Tax=Gigaspora margarita TaxID=4874 RepID=A0A8H4A5N7_GIGMA|nr:hypothetical protein F8M41_006924 [Gigaspora margarita]
MSSTNNSNNPTPPNPAPSNPVPSNPRSANRRSTNRRPQYSNRTYNDPFNPISREAVERYKKMMTGIL